LSERSDARYEGRVVPVDVSLKRMTSFADRIYFRDAKGLSSKPAVLSLPGGEFLRIQGDFLIQYEYFVSSEQGELFLELTNDPNRIHALHNIVPGALTAAKVFLPIEVLMPNLRIRSAKAKFRAAAFYDRRTLSSMRWQYIGAREVKVTVTTYQGGRRVATIAVLGDIDPDFSPPEVKERKVNREELERVTRFFEALGIEPWAYFEKGNTPDYTYPFAYLASLPSAEIVRQMEGQGGMINILSLELGDQPKMPITGKRRPSVRLTADKLRRAFRRILTDIVDGIVTYYRGSAVVNPSAEFL